MAAVIVTAKGINCRVTLAAFDVLAAIITPNSTHLTGANRLTVHDTTDGYHTDHVKKAHLIEAAQHDFNRTKTFHGLE